jgi:cell division protein FtsW
MEEIKQKRIDYFLLVIVGILLIFGFLIIFSASGTISQEKFSNIYYFLNHQLLFGFLPGIILGFLVFKIQLSFLKKWSVIFLLINLIFLATVFFPKIGLKYGGAARWVNLGLTSFQPSEFLKLFFILYLASWLAHRTGRKNQPFNQTLFAFIIILGLISLFLILQPDISTLGIIVAAGIIMYYLSETPLWHTILMGLAGLTALFLIINLAPYRIERIKVFLNPSIDPMGIGYQMKQILITIGSGGIFGSGLGLSPQKFGPFSGKSILPSSITDAIFAILAEETGFIGALVLILLFLLFFWRGIKIGKLAKDKFSKLSAFGITFWIIIQAFVNIGAMIGILPLTGIPLPFISYGGSHLVAELIGVGILLNISRQMKD